MPTFQRNDAFLDIARGRVPGLSITHRVGFNFAVSSIQSTIWPRTGVKPPIPGAFTGSASVLSLVSTNSGDAPGGNGMHSLLIDGIGPDLLTRTEVVTLSGLTPVLTTGTFRYVNRMFGLICAAGSRSNIGEVTASVSAMVIETIPNSPIPGDGRSQSAVFAAALDRDAYISKFEVENDLPGGADTSLLVDIYFRPMDANSSEIVRGLRYTTDTSVHKAVTVQGQHYRLEFDRGPQIPRGTQFEARAVRVGGNQAAKVTCSFDLIIVDEGVYNG